jgi:hypothetical protein
MSQVSRSNQVDHRHQSRMNQIPIGSHSGFAARQIQIQIIKNGTKIRALQKNLDITNFSGS